MQRLNLAMAALACVGSCSAAVNTYVQHNLVSDMAGLADQIDPCLVNPWGIVASATSPFWVAANGSGLSTIYDGNGKPASLIVNIPGPAGVQGPGQQCGKSSKGSGTPTGIIVNDTKSFQISGTPASFLFSSEQGLILGWNGGTGASAALMADRSSAGSVYKGLATATRSDGALLYAADFGNAKVDVYDGDMNLLTLAGAFTDPQIPAGFAPFNIQNLGGSLYVAYAKQDAHHHDDVAGRGNGYVDIYDLNGLLLSRLIAGGALNSPWGMAIAPPDFGAFGGALLIGNFGDGWINAFDLASGAFLGSLQDGSGVPIHISGLWGLVFGNGSRANPATTPSGGDSTTLYFTAGIAGPDSVESHGLLGTIQPAPVINGVANAASFARAITPGAFTAIFGSNLAATTRTWASADFINGKLPVQLDGVSVTINGKPAYVYFVSPAQIDVIAPSDSTTGTVPVVVTNSKVPSGSVTAPLQAVGPAFFTAGKYVIATHANGTLVGSPTSLPGATPATQGETIALYGTGFGPANPPMDGLVVSAPTALADLPALTLGGTPATVAFAGLTAAGLDQVNVIIPALPAGSTGSVDIPVSAAVGGFTSQTQVFVTVQSGK